MSGESVRAIIAGTKTQTRRILKSPHAADADVWSFIPTSGEWESGMCGDHGAIAHGENVRCPYGEPGGRLWVRETWCMAHPDYHTEEEGVRLGRPIKDGRWCHYAATDSVEYNDNRSPWRSPLYMPRWASRLTLEMTDVRVERLQDISESDAKAEGIRGTDDIPPGYISGLGEDETTARGAYAHLWNAINGKRAPWASNPWVWAMTFRRVER